MRLITSWKLSRAFDWKSLGVIGVKNRRQYEGHVPVVNHWSSRLKTAGGDETSCTDQSEHGVVLGDGKLLAERRSGTLWDSFVKRTGAMAG